MQLHNEYASCSYLHHLMKTSLHLKKTTGIVFILSALAMSLAYYNLSSHSSAVAQEANKPYTEINFLIAAIRSGRTEIKPSTATLRISESLSSTYLDMLRGRNPALPKGSQNLLTTAEWIYRNPDVRYRANYEKSLEPRLSSDALSISGNDSKLLQQYVDPERKTGGYNTGSVLTRGESLYNDIGVGFEKYDPRWYGFFYGKSPVDKLLSRETGIESLDKMPTPNYGGEDNIFGSRCMKVNVTPDVGDRWTFWIDTEHNFLVRRVESYTTRYEKLSLYKSINVPELEEVSGSWLPKHIQTKEFSLKRENVGAETKSSDVQISYEAKTSMAEDIFDMRWPLETEVSNLISLEKTLYTAISLLELTSLNSDRKNKGEAVLESKDISSSELYAFNANRNLSGLPPMKDAVAVMLDQDDILLVQQMRRAK